MWKAEAEPWQRAGRIPMTESRSKLATWVTDLDLPGMTRSLGEGTLDRLLSSLRKEEEVKNSAS